MIGSWGLALWIVGAGSAVAGDFPTRFTAQYSLHSRGFTIGQTELALAPLDGERFEYVSKSRATGAAALIRNDRINERSVWRFDGGRVKPLHYHYERSGGNKDRVVEVEFDWPNHAVINTARGKTWRMPVPDGTLDKLSYVLALMQDLEAGLGTGRLCGGRRRQAEDVSAGMARKSHPRHRGGDATDLHGPSYPRG